MVLMYILEKLLQQSQRSQWFHQISKPLFCFCKASLWQRQFLFGDYMLFVFTSSFLFVWNQMPCQKCCLKILCPYSFDNSINCQNLWGCGMISSKAVLIFPKNFLDFRSDTIEEQLFCFSFFLILCQVLPQWTAIGWCLVGH